MARNSLPKTARITIGGTTLMINQNGRVIQGYTKKAAKAISTIPGLAERMLLALRLAGRL